MAHSIVARLRRPRHGWSPERFLGRPSAGLACGIAAIVLVALAALAVPAGPLAVDRRFSGAMGEVSSAALHDLALVFDHLGRGIGRALVLVAIGGALVLARRLWALAVFAVAESLTPIASGLTKLLVGRPRPGEGLVHAPGSSFPSGHTAFAGVTAVSLVLLTTRPGRRALAWLLAAAAIAIMAWSRTYLQVHWLSDVAAGALLGVGVALATFAAAQLLRPPAADP